MKTLNIANRDARWFLTGRCLAGFVVIGCLCAAILASFSAHAGEPAPPPSVQAEPVSVGMEGVFYARYKGPRLAAKPLDEKAPIVLRIADCGQDDVSDLYELRYIGQYPGRFDLRDYLQRVDGGTLDELEPISVTITSLLPEDHSGSLETFAHRPLAGIWPYRLSMGVLGVLWLLPALLFLYRRIMRRRARVRETPSGEETLADRLRPLIERALSGELTGQGKATLERMLIGHWRGELELHDCTTVESLRRMREHRVAGRLLADLERWLHQRPPITNVNLNEVLQPYCGSVAQA